MVILMNILPYLIISLFSVIFSSVLHGLATYFVAKDEVENTKTEKITKPHFEPQYNIWTTLITVITECVLFYFKGLSIDFIFDSILLFILIISYTTDIKACIIPNETNFVRFHYRNIVFFCYYII